MFLQSGALNELFLQSGAPDELVLQSGAPDELSLNISVLGENVTWQTHTEEHFTMNGSKRDDIFKNICYNHTIFCYMPNCISGMVCLRHMNRPMGCRRICTHFYLTLPQQIQCRLKTMQQISIYSITKCSHRCKVQL